MSPRTRSILAQIASFLLAGVLLYLALRGVDLRTVLTALKGADYTWLLPLVAIVLLSHLIRAWRWRVLIKALPEVEFGEREPGSTGAAFSSLMIGYMVNYAAPRLGEVARTATLTARTGIGFGSIFGTVVVDRILDVAALALGLLSVGFLLIDRFSTLNSLFIEPLTTQLGRIPALALLAVIAFIGILVFLVYRQVLRRSSSTIGSFWSERAAPIFASFKSGILTLIRSKNRVGLLVSTVVIWILYVMMAHLPFIMLGMDQAFQISVLDSWSIMLLGAIGVAIPSPGGTGSYHYITIQTLVFLFGVDSESAATYAVLVHASQMVLYVVVGAVCLMLQGSSVRVLRARTMQAPERSRTSEYTDSQS
jgi:hypothetical protein